MTWRATPPPGPRRATAARAFSLIEVIAAVVIFGLGMIAVIGLYGPVTKSVATVADAEAAARVADAVRSRLATLSFESAVALVQDPAAIRKKDGDGAYNPNDGAKYPEVLFASQDGLVGVYDPAENQRQWRVPNPNGALRTMRADEKYFEIDLIRQMTISPAADDAGAAVIAYSMRVRWPAFLRTSSATTVQSAQNPGGGGVTFDHGRKGVLFFAGTISR